MKGKERKSEGRGMGKPGEGYSRAFPAVDYPAPRLEEPLQIH